MPFSFSSNHEISLTVVYVGRSDFLKNELDLFDEFEKHLKSVIKKNKKMSVNQHLFMPKIIKVNSFSLYLNTSLSE